MKKTTPYQLILESLEERVFFDANPVAALVEPTDGGVEETSLDGAEMQAESETVAASQEVEQVDAGASQDDVSVEVEGAASDLAEAQSAADAMMQTEADESDLVVADAGDVDTQAVDSEDVVIPIDPMIGEDFTFTVTYNNDRTETVYGPYIDLVLDRGLEGDEVTDVTRTDDGISFESATYLGVDVEYHTQIVNNAGEVTHNWVKDPNTGEALVITGLNPGDEFVTLRLPFGSFTPDQTAAEIEVTAHMSENADVGDINDPDAALDVTIYRGAMYGLTAADDYTTDNPIRDGGETISFLPEVIAFNTEINVPTVGSDCQEQHDPIADDIREVATDLDTVFEQNYQEIPTGPNFPAEYISTIDIAENQNVDSLVYTQEVPDSIYYTGVTSISVGGVALTPAGYNIVREPTGNQGGALEIQILGTVTGTAADDDVVIHYGFYVPEQNGAGDAIIDPDSADDVHIINNGEVSYHWVPRDAYDPAVTATIYPEVDEDGNFSSNENIDDIFHAEAITIQKSHSPDAGGDDGYVPGEILTYNLDFQISDYFAFGDSNINDSIYAFRIEDVVADGLEVDPTTITIDLWENGTQIATSVALTPGAVGSQVWAETQTDGSIIFFYNLDAILRSAGITGEAADGILQGGETGATTGTITYDATILDQYRVDPATGEHNVDQGDNLQGGVTIYGDVFTKGVVPVATGQSEDDESCDNVNIVTGGVSKSIIAINNSESGWATDGTSEDRPMISPGDTVSYIIRYDMPISSVENFDFVDYLPLPVFNAADPDQDGTDVFNGDPWVEVGADDPARYAAGNWFFTTASTYDTGSFEGLTVDPGQNSLTFSWSNYHDEFDTSSVVEVVFTVAVSNDPFPDGFYLTNQVTAYESGTELENSETNAIDQIVLNEPVLQITKGVINTDNSAGTYDGNVGTVETGTVTETAEADFGLSVDANLSGIDAGDTVTFAIVVQNIGHSDAFDVAISDSLPAGFAIPVTGLNLNVTTGDRSISVAFTDANGLSYGDAAFNFFSGIILTDPGAGAVAANTDNNTTQTDNVVVITYDLVATVDITPGQTLVNTAAITNYAGAEGGADHTIVDPSDTAEVTVGGPTVTKTITGTSQPDAVTSGTDVAIGEEVTYTVQIAVQEGTTESVLFRDNLADNGLQLVSINSISASTDLATTAQGGVWDNIITSNIPTGSYDIYLNFGDITNSNTYNSTPEYITINYTALVLNNSANDRGDNLANNAQWLSGSAVLSSDTETVTVVEPELQISKVADNSSPDEGDTVEFTIVISHTGGSNQDAFDVSFSDTIPDGYENVTILRQVGTGSLTGITTAISSSGTEGRDLTGIWDEFQLGDTYTIVVSAALVANPSGGLDLSNTASIDWTSLPDGDENTDDSNERVGDPANIAYNDYVASATTSVIVDPGAIEKIAPDPSTYTIGETIQYYMIVTLPEGDMVDVQVTDTLPAGLEYVVGSYEVFTTFGTGPTDDPSGLLTSDFDGRISDTSSLNSTVGDGNDIDFSLGNVTVVSDNDSSNNSFVIGFRAIVLNDSVNEDGDTKINVATLSYDDPNDSGNDRITVNETDPTDSVATIVEPQITTTKTVVDADGGVGDTQADNLNDIMTYTVVMENTGRGTAYEVSLSDALAIGTEFIAVNSISITTSSVPSNAVTDPDLITFTNTDGLLEFSDDSWDLEVGETLTIRYDVRVVEAWFVGGNHINVADADWSGRNGEDANERIYDDSDTRNPGMSQDGTQDTATAIFTVPLGDGTIGDTVWFDVVADGVQDAGETGIAGVTVTAEVISPLDGATVYSLTAITDSSGNYSFTHLPDATYNIHVESSTLPSGMTQTFDYDLGTNVLDHTGSYEITDSANGETFLDVDFGYTGQGSVGDYVWYDTSQDGIQNEIDQGIEGAEVTLHGDLDGDGTYEYTATATTNEDGFYQFTNLPLENYWVEVSSPIGLTNETYERDGSLDNRVDIADTEWDSTDPSIQDLDFGFVGTGSIGNYIWNNLNGDNSQDGESGIANVTVTLTGDLDNDGIDETLTTVTDADGLYHFDNLPSGDFTITVDESTLPESFVLTSDPDGPRDSSSTVTLAAGETNNAQDFGYTETGSIGDTIFFDVNNNGIQDSGDVGIAGVEVTLIGDVDLDGTPDTLTAVTDRNGNYLFDGILPGDYSVTVNPSTLPAGINQTYDLDGLDTPDASDLSLVAGEDNLDVDFGYTGTGSIGDTVWYDLDEDGVLDPGEEGIAGVKITLKGDFDGDGVTDVVLETTTDTNGNYSFDNLFAGAYTLTADPSSVINNYYPVYDLDGLFDNTTTIQLGAGEVNNNVDFGYKLVIVPPEPPTVRPPEIVEPGFIYDPLFQSYVEGGERRDVDEFIEMRAEDSVFQEPLLPVSPIYTGHAEPGTTLRINLTDAQGNFVGTQLVMADTGGNWLANFAGSLMYDMPHSIEIQQDLSLYNASTAGGFNLRTYFMPALSDSPFTSLALSVDSIFATRPFVILETLSEYYNQSSGLAWDDHYDYEYIAVSTNPSQSTL
ncbi:SdrD B-like domain-containing protein [Desulforhopalus sp. IMCC35007]|uniref:SdrD B-like domain-containing protein n=1 Tax=Desulforhopalus sp. IMCC35007 TaxID=2569543 RepID=UPI0010ADD615|nr:SdrD B-like domain-containing protein [Desulforhopalus sp. IMCC35007]TKB05876.1 hypothetical protein FCL48_23135 [Desulforhopalus sp. IMCC35007]